MEQVICKQIKCKDYLTDEGDPAWCYWAGQPAQVAINKCPKILSKQDGRKICQSEDLTIKNAKNKK